MEAPPVKSCVMVVTRPWRERLFTRPWRPWCRYVVWEFDAALEGVWETDEGLEAPFTVMPGTFRERLAVFVPEEQRP